MSVTSNFRLSRWTWAYLGFVAFSLFGSLLSRVLHVNPGPIAPISSFLTLGLGTAAVFAPFFQADPRRAGWAPCALLVLGTVVELTGVSTGFPFGNYIYTDRWAPVVPLPSRGYFPLQVPFAWALVVGASNFAVTRPQGGAEVASVTGANIHVPLAPFLIALVAAALDLVMEPVMAGPLHYWQWVTPGPLPGGAPILNTVGWFGTSLVGALALRLLSSNRVDSRGNARAVLAGHLLLTLGLGVIMSLGTGSA